MANAPEPSVTPVKHVEKTKRKRTHSTADLDGDDEDDVVNKYKKFSIGKENTQICESSRPTPLKKLASDNSIATSPLADSGYELSVVNTPASSLPGKYVQPGSSGYISGSDCGTPAGNQRTPGPFSPDFITKGKKTIVPLSPRHLETFLQKKFVLLKDEVDPSGVADILNSEGIISNNEVEMIRQEKFRIEKCDILLKSIVRSKLKCDIHTPRKVIAAFEKEGYGHLFEDFEKEKERNKKPCKEEGLTNKDIKGRFYRISTYLEDEIDPLLIIDDLVSEQVLTFDEHQDIKTTGFKPKKVEYLIEYILKKPSSDFWMFCDVLEGHYPQLAEILRSGTPGPTLTDCRPTSLIDVTCVKGLVETNDVHRKCTIYPGSKEKTEVKLVFNGNGKEEEQMIVDDNTPDVDFGLQEEAMEIGFDIPGIQFSCIRIGLMNMSKQSQMMLLKKCRESPIFLEKWIQKMISEKQMLRLQEKHIDKISFQVKMCLPDVDQRQCSCKLTKEAIVKHYSSLERNLRHVDKMIEVFARFEGFDDETKSMFNNLLSNDNTRPIVERFLQTMLDLHDSRIHLCLLEKTMRETNPELLKEVTKTKCENKEIKLSAADLRRNMNFLVEELEPRHFRELLTGIDGSERVVEKVMSTLPRKERCKELLNFIIQKKSTDRFVQELQRRNKTHIVDFLMTSRQDTETADHDDLKEALIFHYKRIIEEVEPRAFRQTFVERREIKAKEYDAIYKLPSRRQRAICLMRNILKRSGSTWKCLVDALEITGYKHIVQLINTHKDSYKECPRLYQSTACRHRHVTLKGELQIKLREGNVKKSALQVFLLRSIFASESHEINNIVGDETNDEVSTAPSDYLIAKSNMTREWVKRQQMDLKRKQNDFDETERIEIEQHTENKQRRYEVGYAVTELSHTSSPTFGMPRQGDFCSSPPLTRSSSRESEERPQYEDISPAASPIHENNDRPHVIIEAPCSPLNMFQSKRRNSLSDGSSCTSSPSTMGFCNGASIMTREQNQISGLYRSMSNVMQDKLNRRVEVLLSSYIKGKKKSDTF